MASPNPNTDAAGAKTIKAIRAVADLIEDTVNEMGPNGTPSGVVYAALMGHVSLDAYMSIIRVMEQLGRIRQSGDMLFPVARS